jgi:hypothetical protein
MDRVNTRAILAAMHANRVVEARRLEAAAARRDPDDTDAIQARDIAADLRAEAEALREALQTMGGVHIPDPRQISLFADGGPT